MSAARQQVLFGNTARAMGDAPSNCLKAKALGIPVSEVPK
jgi:hypothetical protein